MSNKKISELATVSYKDSLLLPAIDINLPVGGQNVNVFAASLHGAGILGPTGPQGQPGPQGPQGLAGVGLHYRGSWVSGASYAPADYVFDQGNTSPSSMWILTGTTNYISTIQPKNDLTHWAEYTAPPGPTGPAFQEAPVDPQTYGRHSATWTPVLPMSGGTLTGTGNNLTANTIATGSTTARSLQDRAADLLNPKDFGAKMDGSTVDSTAMNSVRAAVKTNGTIYVPSGGWNAPTTPTAGPANGSVLWRLNGNYFGVGGTTPVTSIGTSQDFVETFFTGTKYFGKLHNPINAHPGLRLDYALDTVGGSNGWTCPAFQINTTVNTGVVDSPWGIMSNLTVNANFNNFWPQPVGIGVNVYKNASAQSWGMGVWINDSQGLSSLTGGGINGMEMGIVVNGLDDGHGSGYGGRRFLDLIVSTHGTGTAGEVGNGVLVHSGIGDPASVHHGFHTLGNISYSFTCEATNGVVGLDTSLATLSGSAIRLAAGQKLSFIGTEDRFLQYTTAAPTPRLRYMIGSTEVWSISDAGNMSATNLVSNTTITGTWTFGTTTAPATVIAYLPKSKVGLVSGQLWNNSGVVSIIP